MADGKLIFDTGLDQKGINGDIGSLKSTMTSAFAKIGTAIGTYLAVDKIIEFGSACVKAAAQVQAETAQFEASFGDLQGAATEAFASISNDTGTLATRLRVEGTKAFSQFKGAGLDAGQALEKMDEATRLAADGAAYYDMSLEETSELLRSFIRGNTEAGDRIGLFTSETQRNQKALDTLGKKYLECTEAEKQMIMLDIASSIYESSGAMGQAAREADGYENVMGNLKEAWRQFMAALGQPMLEALVPVIKNITSTLGDLEGEAPKVAKSIGDVAQKVADFAILMINNRDKVVAATKAIVAAFVMTKAISSLAAVSKAWGLATKAVETHMVANNIMMVATAKSAAGLTVAQLAVGVLTGKITLCAAAQAAWNIVTSANPILLLVSAIAAVVTAIAIYKSSTEDAKTSTEILIDEINDASDKLDAHTESFYQLKEAQDEAMQSGVAEVNYLAQLKDELDSLVDANGRVKEGYEGRAQFIINELSQATGIEMSLVDGVISKYGELSGAIDAYIEKRRAQVIVETQEDAYREAIAGMDEALAHAAEVYGKLQEARDAYDAVMAEKMTAANSVELEMRRRNAAEALEAAESKWSEAEGQVRDYVSAIEQYEGDYAAFAQGNYDQIVQAHQKYANGYKDMTAATKTELQEQIAAIQTNLAMQQQLYDETGSEIYAGNIETLQAMLADYETQLANMTSTVQNNTPTITDAWSSLAQQSVTAAASQNGTGGGMEVAGSDAASSYQSGVTLGTPTAVLMAQFMAQSAKDAAASENGQGGGMEGAGTGSADSFKGGISKGTPMATSAAELMAQLGKKAAGGVDFTPVGSGAAGQVSSGINSGAPGVSGTARGTVESARASAAGVSFWTVGSGISSGIAAGIASGVGSLVSAAVGAVRSAYDAAKRWLGIQSPSKMTRFGIGQPFSQGVAVGIEGDTPNLMATARKSAANAVAAFRSAIDSAQLSTSLSLAPVAVVSGAAPAPAGGITFIQHNTSPKALSESEISLNTRNLLKRAKWELK